jgi:predicted dehydrogenase
VKLLWRGTWIDAPAYHAEEPGIVVDVDAVLPLWRIEAASARPTRRPHRKVAVFLMTDGLRSTLRKARTKRQEPLFSGDYRVAVLLGRTMSVNQRVIALALRVPPAAQQVVVHRHLVQEVDEAFSERELVAVADTLAADSGEIKWMTRQNYLYSGMDPPAELLQRWEKALSSAAAARQTSSFSVPSSNSGNGGLAVETSEPRRPIRPPKGAPLPPDTLLRFERPPNQTSDHPVALLGAGDYARTEIIPALRSAGFGLYVVADRDPQIATLVGQRYGFQMATTDPQRAIREVDFPGLVVVSTAHDSHAELACDAAEAGHRVFLEKPPTVTFGDVARLAGVMSTRPGVIEIGYNRRYHPLIKRAQSLLRGESGPTSITCVVKELDFLQDHWYFWANQGTRVTGNLCHWIDLAIALLDGEPLPISLTLSPRIPNAVMDDEERVLTVTFEDGSLFTILGTTRGDDIRGVQEQIDIRRGRATITIDDLWKLRVRRGGFERYYRTMFRTKAHTYMYREALRRAIRDEPAVYKVRDMVVVSAIQVAASDLVRADERVGDIPTWLVPTLEALHREPHRVSQSQKLPSQRR